MIKISTQTDPFAIRSVGAFMPSAVAPRIVAQRGLFTIHPAPTQALRITRPALDLYDIDVLDRPYFERKLFGFAVDPGVIKADLDGICETLAWQFKRRVAVGAFNY